jgi:hypothetical protein
MPKVHTRIDIPNSADQLIKLAQCIAAENARLGKESSPLSQLGWEAASDKGGLLSETVRLQADAERYARLAEEAYQKRKRSLAQLGKLVRRSRDVLKGVHGETLKKLVNYGFQVDDSPRPKRKNLATKASSSQATMSSRAGGTVEGTPDAVLSN